MQVTVNSFTRMALLTLKRFSYNYLFFSKLPFLWLFDIFWSPIEFGRYRTHEDLYGCVRVCIAVSVVQPFIFISDVVDER